MSPGKRKGRPGQGDLISRNVNDTADTTRQSPYVSGNTWWDSCADQAMRALTKTRRPFTIDELAVLVTRPDRPERYGALFAAWANAGRIQCVGSRLSADDGRPLRVWQAIGGTDTDG